MVGIVVTISPSFSLYKMVVFPAASRPTIRILISRFANSIFTSLDIAKPIPSSEKTNQVWDKMITKKYSNYPQNLQTFTTKGEGKNHNLKFYEECLVHQHAALKRKSLFNLQRPATKDYVPAQNFIKQTRSGPRWEE